MAIITIVSLNAGLIYFITEPEEMKPDIDDYLAVDPADPTTRISESNFKFAYKKAEQEFDQEKRKAYGILSAQIKVDSPAEVLILAAFSSALKVFTKWSERMPLSTGQIDYSNTVST